MQEHPLVDLYISIENDQENALIEQMLSSVNLDNIVLYTLEKADIHQPLVLTLLITDEDGIRDMNKQYREQETVVPPTVSRVRGDGWGMTASEWGEVR